MKTVNFLSGVLLAMALCGRVSAAPASYEVVPLPQRVQLTKGAAFQLSDDVQILAAPNLPLLPFRMLPASHGEGCTSTVRVISSLRIS